MTYSEFRKTYRDMLKKYPGTGNIYREDMQETIGTCIKTTYTKRGSRWIETEKERAEFTRANYCNCVDAVPFFRALGGYEKVETGYTYKGFLPVQINSISPDKKQKIVRTFVFDI